MEKRNSQNNILLITVKTMIVLLIAILTLQIVLGASCTPSDCTPACISGCVCTGNPPSIACGCDCGTGFSPDGSCSCTNGNNVKMCAQSNPPNPPCQICHDIYQTCECEFKSATPVGYPRCVDQYTIREVFPLSLGGSIVCGDAEYRDCRDDGIGFECVGSAGSAHCEVTEKGCQLCGDTTWDCTGEDFLNERCGDNTQIGGIVVANTGCSINNDLRFRCSSNVWRSCSAPRGTWDWTTENLIAGDKRDGRCCDPSQGGTYTWSYCGDGRKNTACGEQCDDGNTISGDGCSSTCKLDACKVCGDGTWDCLGTLSTNQRCGDNTQIGGIVVANTGCSINNDLRFRCSSNVWRSCSAPRGTWDWTTENLIAGDKRDGRCCDPSQIGEKKWSYCGDGKCNTACGENGNTCISDCCSAEVCTLGTGDEDCDSETNWDSSDGIHGDNNCAVGVTAVAVSDTTPCPGETITVSCTSTVANINSIQAFIDSTNIESGFLGWSGSVARFQWPAPSTTGSHTVKCSIDTSKSYKSGTDKTTTITVGGSSCCSQYTPSGSGTCEADTACDWCPECSSRQYSGGTGRCVATGTCSFACSVGSCTAQCDASTNPSCTIGGYPGIRNCNLATCLWGSCIPTGTCGDSITNGPEVCDSGAGNGVPCIPPYGGSCQYCSADCSQLLTVTGPSCGDDIIQSPPEQCDDGAGNGIPCTPPYAGTCNWCDNSCVTQTEIGPYCGDLIVNGPEACEGSACQAGCTTQRCDPSTCQYYNPSPESSCTDDIDNDCDCATDGCDAECQEGQGTNNRCCADGVDNDGDTYIDEDDPGCCDLCLTPFGFDDPAAACGTLTFNWELSPPSMNQRCCGDDSPSENFISTYIARYTSTFYACCDQPTDCVDQNGECQSGDEEQFDLCINGVDDDCDGYIDRADGSCQGVVTGIIFNEEGFRLDGAIVTGRPAGLGEAYESQSTLSDFNGNYVINNALIGTYNFVARREGYDDDIRTVTISTAGTTYQNFTLINGSCHADCTDYYKNCNPACEGQTFKEGTCNFITTLCHNRPKDFVVRYENTTTGMMHEFICCDGLETINPVIKATVTSQIENIYDFVAKVKYRGSFANFHMLVWNSED